MNVPGGAYKRGKIQDAVAVTGNGGVVDVIDVADGGYAAIAFQVTGTFTATVNFECTVDGTNWVALECTSVSNSTTPVTTATAAGIWKAAVLGLYQVRARVTWTSGTSVTVTFALVA